MDDFERDIESIMEKLRGDLDDFEYSRLLRLRDRLLMLHKRNMVKINHSVMELVCAKYLIKRGFRVEIEYTLNGVSCDIYAIKGLGTLIVEVETGFVPPEHALDPQRYLRARIASKIIRYSSYANKFCLATPPHYIMPIPRALLKPPRYRTEVEVETLKRLCDLYYTRPPVTLEEVRNARLHSIYVIDVDEASVMEMDVEVYADRGLWDVSALRWIMENL